MRSIEERVSDLEKEIADLKRQLERRPKRVNTNIKIVLLAEEFIERLYSEELHLSEARAVLSETERLLKKMGI